MRGRAVALLLGVAACPSTSTFPCMSDSECSVNGAPGVCAGPGFCAFEDVACPSGLRYGGFADPGLANECVEATGTTSAAASSTSSPPATAADDEMDSTSPAGDTVAATASISSTTAPKSDSSAGVCPPDWWDCAWSHRRDITVSLAGQALDDFPALVVLTDERIDFGVANGGGDDVRFVLNDEVLPHETVAWEPGGATELWVRIPNLQDGVEFQLYYGNGAAPRQSNPADVWTNGYLAVMHMLDESDSLGTLQLAGTNADATPGLTGDGLLFDGFSSYLQDQGPPIDLFAGGATITALFNASGWGQGGFGRIVDASNINTTATGYSMSLGQAGDGILEAVRFSRGFEMTRGTWSSENNSASLSTWIVASVAYADGALPVPLFWVNGQPSPPVFVSAPAGAPVPPPVPLTIGALGNTNLRFFDGVIDEVHIATEVRTDDWAAAEQLSLTDQLLAFGDEETL